MRSETHFSPERDPAFQTRAYWYYKRPSCSPVLVVSTGFLHCFSLLSHYCWLCFLGLRVSRTYSFQHSRHLESMQAGDPELATEALRKLDGTGRGVSKAWGMVRGGWYHRKPALPPFPLAAGSSQKPGPCYTPPSGGLQNQFPSKQNKTKTIYS